MDTPEEWLDVVVLCHFCHKTFHEENKAASPLGRSRRDMLFDLARVLNSCGAETPFFRKHGKEMHDRWMAAQTPPKLSTKPKFVLTDFRIGEKNALADQIKDREKARKKAEKAARREKRRIENLEKSRLGHEKVRARCAIDQEYKTRKEKQHEEHRIKKLSNKIDRNNRRNTRRNSMIDAWPKTSSLY